jgi:hypothetical protein
MKNAHDEALRISRASGSFEVAAKLTGLDLPAVQRLWRDATAPIDDDEGSGEPLPIVEDWRSQAWSNGGPRPAQCMGRTCRLWHVYSPPAGEHEIRIEWEDGTFTDDLVMMPDGVNADEWFASLVPDELPVFTARVGRTEKRFRVRIMELEERVDRLEALLLAAPEKVEIPEFLKAKEDDMEFAEDFISREALEGEERPDTVARLQLLFEVLTNRSYGGPLSDEDQARLSELTTNLRLGG